MAKCGHSHGLTSGSEGTVVMTLFARRLSQLNLIWEIWKFAKTAWTQELNKHMAFSIFPEIAHQSSIALAPLMFLLSMWSSQISQPRSLKFGVWRHGFPMSCVHVNAKVIQYPMWVLFTHVHVHCFLYDKAGQNAAEERPGRFQYFHCTVGLLCYDVSMV